MLGCLNAMEDTKTSNETRICAVLDAYSILRSMDFRWPDISDKDKLKAHYYWGRIVQPSARRLGLILDGEEPQYVETRVVAITCDTDPGSIRLKTSI